MIERSYSLGDVVYVEALGQPIVILGSMQAATDLLEKRSLNTSDRPVLSMPKLYVSIWDAGTFVSDYLL
jgi:hypothetical protein